MLLFVAVAGATCAGPGLIGTFPPDGAEVPRSIHPAMVYTDGGCGSPSLQVLDVEGVPATGGFDDTGSMLTFVPEPPLTPGEWSLVGLENSTFTVADGADFPIAGVPQGVEVRPERVCGRHATHVGASVFFDEPGSGILLLAVEKGSSLLRSAVTVLDGEGSVEVSQTFDVKGDLSHEPTRAVAVRPAPAALRAQAAAPQRVSQRFRCSFRIVLSEVM
ncbi:MAG: hypothetical protein KC621_29605 [Myxococcales bacterium]|nr:hypothetical protein [Myxococcales bacterium]